MLKPRISYFDYVHHIFPDNSIPKKQMRDITFQVTEDCNLKCSYCYQINKTHKKMDFNIAKKFIDYIFDNKNDPNSYYYEGNVKGFVIEFIGGEPFLEIDLIEQIIDYFESKFIQYPESSWFLCHIYNFSTNGTLYFTPKVQKFISKYRDLISIGVTVDGNKKLHDSCRLFPNGEGSYDLAIAASLSEATQGYENSKITVSPENVNFVFDGVTNLISLGFHHIHINCCFEDVWNDNKDSITLFYQLKKLADWIVKNDLYDKIYIAFFNADSYTPASTSSFLDHNWCGAGMGNMLAIGYNGRMYPCLRFMETSLKANTKPLVIGDLNNGILGTEEYKYNKEILNSCTRKSMSEEKCLNCSISAGCAWCIGQCYEENGNLNKKTNHICNPYKMAALATKYLCLIVNDIENYNKIKLSYDMYKDLIPEKQFNQICKGVK